jgi:hypothetical protein
MSRAKAGATKVALRTAAATIERRADMWFSPGLVTLLGEERWDGYGRFADG